MSNLGWYQTFTTVAKTVGGPKRLLGLVLAGGATVGAAIGVGGTILTQKVVKAKNKINTENSRYTENPKIFAVHTEGMDNNGLVFRVGDNYRILNSDADAILIEKYGDNNNPYFVSAKFLENVSDFIPDK